MHNYKKIHSEEYFDKEYQRKIEDSFDDIDVTAEHLENAFTNKKYYLAMKSLPLLEKQVLYYSAIEYQPLNWISKKLKLSKTEIIKLLNKAKNDFKKNLKKINKRGN